MPEQDLQPARESAAVLIPPDLALLDREAGRLEEQTRQLHRVSRSFERRSEISARIEEIKRLEVALRREVSGQHAAVDFSELGALIQDRMNTYLNDLKQADPQRWEHGPVVFLLRERDFQVKIKGNKWSSQIGATSQALVLFAYHYALMSLVADGKFNYPGLVIIDFPVQLADGTSVADKENYLVEPFIRLCKKEGMEKAQFLAAGRAFENLEGAGRIVLRRRS